VDILSEILGGARWKGDLLTRKSLYKPWGLRFPCEKSAGFHIVSQGSCFVKTPKKTFALEAGDILFIARGSTHDLSSAPGEKIVDVAKFNERTAQVSGVSKPITTFVSIRYEIPEGPMHPFILELPEYIFIRGRDVPAHHTLHTLLVLISQEIDAGIGSDLILQKLADILLYQVLRYYMEKNPPKHNGWRTALSDGKIRAALENLHLKVDHPWTLALLAASVGVSRASLAARFKDALGVTPMHYLAALRIERGKALTAETGATLEEVARSVGYSSGFAYSKAFKRLRGKSPGREGMRSQPSSPRRDFKGPGASHS
jgi:AraC-like DNA-binding protein